MRFWGAWACLLMLESAVCDVTSRLWVGIGMNPGITPFDFVTCAEHVFPEVRQVFPPPRDVILAWSTMFRSGGTFRHYLGYVKTGCMVMNKPTEVSGAW